MSMPPNNNKPTGSRHIGQLQDIFEQIAMNPTAFDNTIRAHGIRMVHARPVPCPNIKSLYDGNHDPSCKMCQNGFIYYAQKDIIGLFSGNQLNKQLPINGVYDYDQASIVIPSKYPDGTYCDLQVFDRIFLPEHPPVRYYQRVEHSQTGIDRLEFPAVSVEFLVDSKGVKYVFGVDFELNTAGNIHWLASGKRPAYQMDTDSGQVYSLTYYTRPTLTIISLPHQLRVTQTIKDGVSVVERFHQVAVVKKDFIPSRPDDVFGPSDQGEPRDGQV